MALADAQIITKESIKSFMTKHEPDLMATQPRVCVPVISRMYRKMKAGIYFSPVKTNGTLLCDGHHRYIASLLAGKKIERVPALSAPSVKVISWHDVFFDEEEWDTEAKINMLNGQDALYNGMTLEKLLRLLR